MASRYAYLLTALMLPAAAVFADWVWRRAGWPRWLVLVVGVGITGLFLVNGVKQALEYTSARALLVGDLQARVTATFDIAGEGRRLLTQLPSATYNPDITVAALESVRDRLATVPVSPEARLATEGELLVSVTPGDPGLAAAPTPSLVGFTPGTASPECQSYAAGPGPELVSYPVPASGAQLQIVGSETQIDTRLVTGGTVGPWRATTVMSGVPTFVASTATGATLEMSFDAQGQTTICTS
jgi:hypothetical protein